MGQEYDPFPTDTAKWSVYSSKSTPGEYSEWTTYYYLNGDTIIDSVSYSKIYRNPTQSYVIDTLNSIYVGGLREFNKEIFFKPKELKQSFFINCELYNLDLSEIRLYTFNLELGEVFYPSVYSEEYTVSDIDSIFIGTEHRKIYTFQTNTSPIGDKWIEGIGSLLSLFGPFCYLFEAVDLTLCFEYDSGLFISDVWDPYEGCNHLMLACPIKQSVRL